MIFFLIFENNLFHNSCFYNKLAFRCNFSYTLEVMGAES
jgi:hypothetical protein